ncbi:hypothetical protein Tco_1231232, partial [Tanacetum coccineum]
QPSGPSILVSLEERALKQNGDVPKTGRHSPERAPSEFKHCLSHIAVWSVADYQRFARTINKLIKNGQNGLTQCSPVYTTKPSVPDITLDTASHQGEARYIVFTLTRFFRDAAINCPVKPKLTQIEDSGERSSRDKIIHLDKFDPDKFLKPLIASSGISCSAESPSLTGVKSGSIFRKLHEILPANRSNLSVDNQKQIPSLKLANTQFSMKTDVRSTNNEIVDLTLTSNRLTAPYFQKKRKLGNVKDENLSQRCESSCESRNRKGVQECCSSLQVREKLSDGEYKEFVNLMKALKSKAMKIGQCLQSIINLFAAPDRLSLIPRFKDYIPAKYHSLYDQYLQNTSNATINL